MICIYVQCAWHADVPGWIVVVWIWWILRGDSWVLGVCWCFWGPATLTVWMTWVPKCGNPCVAGGMRSAAACEAGFLFNNWYLNEMMVGYSGNCVALCFWRYGCWFHVHPGASGGQFCFCLALSPDIISYAVPVSVSHIYSACCWQVLMSPFLCKTIDSQTEIWHCNESVGGGGGRVVE